MFQPKSTCAAISTKYSTIRLIIYVQGSAYIGKMLKTCHNFIYLIDI